MKGQDREIDAWINHISHQILKKIDADATAFQNNSRSSLSLLSPNLPATANQAAKNPKITIINTKIEETTPTVLKKDIDLIFQTRKRKTDLC